MNEDELNGFKKALKLLDWFYEWYESRGDLSQDFLLGFAQATNLLYFNITEFYGEEISDNLSNRRK